MGRGITGVQALLLDREQEGSGPSPTVLSCRCQEGAEDGAGGWDLSRLSC